MHQIKAKGDQPETVRSNWNMDCPKCGEDTDLLILALSTVRLLPDGTEDVGGGVDWSGNSSMLCRACGFPGKAHDFYITAQAER